MALRAFKYLSLFVSLLFLGVGCSRPVEQSTLRISLPGVPSSIAKPMSSKIISQSVSSQTATANNEGPPWDISKNPATISDINCYGVMVGGPEPGLSFHSAHDLNGQLKLSFGPWIAAVPAGGFVELDVPSGPAREITLVGFKAESTTSCFDYRFTDPPRNAVSQPFILGQIRRDLAPGEVTVDMVASFDDNESLWEFYGPDFNDLGGVGTGPVQNLALSFKGDYTNINRDICLAVELEGFDSNGFIGKYDVARSINLTATKGQFYSNAGCTNTLSSVVIAADDFAYRTIYYQGNVSATNSDLTATDSLGQLTPVTISPFQTINGASLGAGTGVDIHAPFELFKDVCHGIYIVTLDAGGLPASFGGTLKIESDTAENFYSDSDCTSVLTTGTDFTVAGDSPMIYFKSSSSNPDITITVKNSGGSVTHATVANIPLSAPGLPTHSFTKVEPYADNHHIMHSGLCYPVKVGVFNNSGAPAAVMTATNYHVSVNNGLLYSSSSSCNSGTGGLTDIVGNIAASVDYDETLYLRPGAGQVEMNVQVDGLPPEDFFIHADQTQFSMTPVVSVSFCQLLTVKLQDSSLTDIPGAELTNTVINFNVSSLIGGPVFSTSCGSGMSSLAGSFAASSSFSFNYSTDAGNNETLDFAITGDSASYILADPVSFSW